MIPKDNNVIDLAKRRRAKGSTQKQAKKVVAKEEQKEQAPVVDMTERRNEQIRQERRQVKRTILTEFIGAFAVVPQKGLMRVALYDISENGLAFDVETDTGKFEKGEELAMRVYLNQVTYFPFLVKVRNVRAVPEESCYRHGADFVKGSLNNDALSHFVKFIETVSASLERDSGDVMVSNLKD